MKNIVIKLGSSVLFTDKNELDKSYISQLVDLCQALHDKNCGVTLVVSGAVACGSQFIYVSPTDSLSKQAAAGIGQSHLMSSLMELFSKENIVVAQILLTKEIISDSTKKTTLSNLVQYYIQNKVVPIFNENDVVDLNCFGGNDFLAAQVTISLKADKLFILSTMKASKHGVGGGKAKLDAVNQVKEKNIDVRIINGEFKEKILQAVL